MFFDEETIPEEIKAMFCVPCLSRVQRNLKGATGKPKVPWRNPLQEMLRRFLQPQGGALRGSMVQVGWRVIS